jgi:hypothetical protein
MMMWPLPEPKQEDPEPLALPIDDDGILNLDDILGGGGGGGGGRNKDKGGGKKKRGTSRGPGALGMWMLGGAAKSKSHLKGDKRPDVAAGSQHGAADQGVCIVMWVMTLVGTERVGTGRLMKGRREWQGCKYGKDGGRLLICSLIFETSTSTTTHRQTTTLFAIRTAEIRSTCTNTAHPLHGHYSIGYFRRHGFFLSTRSGLVFHASGDEQWMNFWFLGLGLAGVLLIHIHPTHLTKIGSSHVPNDETKSHERFWVTSI